MEYPYQKEFEVFQMFIPSIPAAIFSDARADPNLVNSIPRPDLDRLSVLRKCSMIAKDSTLLKQISMSGTVADSLAD